MGSKICNKTYCVQVKLWHVCNNIATEMKQQTVFELLLVAGGQALSSIQFSLEGV